MSHENVTTKSIRRTPNPMYLRFGRKCQLQLRKRHRHNCMRCTRQVKVKGKIEHMHNAHEYGFQFSSTHIHTHSRTSLSPTNLIGIEMSSIAATNWDQKRWSDILVGETIVGCNWIHFHAWRACRLPENIYINPYRGIAIESDGILLVSPVLSTFGKYSRSRH